MNLGLVGISVLLTYWQRAFYNAIEAKDWRGFLALLFTYRISSVDGFTLGFAPFAALFVFCTVWAQYLQQTLQVHWRRWLTAEFIDRWLSGRSYHLMSLAQGGAENPDQRIAEDVNLFVEGVLKLGLGFLKTFVSFVSFVFVLWSLSGTVNVLGRQVHGYLVWLALVYSSVATVLTHLLGRRLVYLNFLRQKAEADFRFSLIRVRENADSIALHASEATEHLDLSGRLDALVATLREIIAVTRRAFFLITGFQQAALVFPLAIVAPAFFAGRMLLGGIFQAANAFTQVQTAFSWISDNYLELANWLATVARLEGFVSDTALRRSYSRPHVDQGGEDLVMSGLTLCHPDGSLLLKPTDLTIRRGDRIVISGPSGTGKSTLLRAVAGIWPFGSGRLIVPSGRLMFLPQSPYIPEGTLRHALCYPMTEAEVDYDPLVNTLRDVGLAHLAAQLDVSDTWAARLSGGEQQLLVLARVLLYRPDWLFMDESTSNLDVAAERHVLTLLLERLGDATLLVITHQPAVWGEVFRQINLADGLLQFTAPATP